MTVTPFCYPAFAFMFTGLVNSRIQSRHGNDFAGTFKLIDVATHLNEKIGGSFVSDTFYGRKDKLTASGLYLQKDFFCITLFNPKRKK